MVKAPWILFHWPWKSRLAGSALYEQVSRFVEACAVNPTPDSAALTVYDASILPDAAAAFGSTDLMRAWRFTKPFELAPLLAFANAREQRAAYPVDLAITYWFDVKHPGATTALFSDTQLQSSVTVHLGLRSVNLALRYATAELTPELREANDAIVATLGIKRNRGVIQRITYSASGDERRERLA